MRIALLSTAVLLSIGVSACSSENYEKIDELATDQWKAQLNERGIKKMSIECSGGYSPSFGYSKVSNYKISGSKGTKEGTSSYCPDNINKLNIDNMPNQVHVYFDNEIKKDKVDANSLFKEITLVFETSIEKYDESLNKEKTWK